MAIRKRRLPKMQERPMQPSPIDQRANEIAKSMDQYRQDRIAGREEGRKYGEDFLQRNVQGLTPQQRLAMQENAQSRINRDLQGYQRQLATSQGRRGVRGGAAFAQRANLGRMASEAQNAYQRDINQLDADLAMRKLAQLFAIEQGESSMRGLDRQLAEDEYDLREQRKRERAIYDKYSPIFDRI